MARGGWRRGALPALGLAKLSYSLLSEAFVVLATVGWDRQRGKTRAAGLLPALALRPGERPGYLYPADAEFRARATLFVAAIQLDKEGTYLGTLGLSRPRL